MTDWRYRECSRFANDEYIYAPWYWEDFYQSSEHANMHFCHIAKEDQTMIAFTENEQKGEADRQTRMRPGRYLQRYFGDKLSADEIRKWANKFGVPELKIARTEDEIEYVYTNGPSSCMAYPASSYRSPFHPVRVYAGPDLAVAYIQRGDDITARTVIWPDRKSYTRIYGDSDRITQALHDLGYSDNGIVGARIQRHEHNGAFVCPFVDYIDTMSDDGEYLVLDDCGPYDCQQTCGLTEDLPTCDRCGDGMRDGDHYWISSVEERWCESCYSESAWTCGSCDRTRTEDDESYSVNTRWGEQEWCQRCYENSSWYCDSCDTTMSDAISATDVEGSSYCPSCRDEHAERCDTCQEYFLDLSDHEGCKPPLPNSVLVLVNNEVCVVADFTSNLPYYGDQRPPLFFSRREMVLYRWMRGGYALAVEQDGIEDQIRNATERYNLHEAYKFLPAGMVTAIVWRGELQPVEVVDSPTPPYNWLGADLILDRSTGRLRKLVNASGERFWATHGVSESQEAVSLIRNAYLSQHHPTDLATIRELITLDHVRAHYGVTPFADIKGYAVVEWQGRLQPIAILDRQTSWRAEGLTDVCYRIDADCPIRRGPQGWSTFLLSQDIEFRQLFAAARRFNTLAEAQAACRVTSNTALQVGDVFDVTLCNVPVQVQIVDYFVRGRDFDYAFHFAKDDLKVYAAITGYEYPTRYCQEVYDQILAQTDLPVGRTVTVNWEGAIFPITVMQSVPDCLALEAYVFCKDDRYVYGGNGLHARPFQFMESSSRDIEALIREALCQPQLQEAA